MKSILSASACLAALFPIAAPAQPAPRLLIGGHGDDVSAFIAQHDDDGDGRLTWAEFDAFRRHRFDATDANGDGVVDVEEYVREFNERSQQARRQERDAQIEQTQTRFTSLDADKDGIVTRAEFDASGERVFEHGQKQLAQRLEQARQAGSIDEKTRILATRARNRLRLPSSHDAAGFIELYDDDGDDKVSRAEFDRARNEQFARTDADGDGALSHAEYLAEYRDRLDRRHAELRDATDKQTRVRFSALDADKDGKMSFEEYQVSGKRGFDRADRDHNGVVDTEDAKLPPPPRPPREENPTP